MCLWGTEGYFSTYLASGKSQSVISIFITSRQSLQLDLRVGLKVGARWPLAKMALATGANTGTRLQSGRGVSLLKAGASSVSEGASQQYRTWTSSSLHWEKAATLGSQESQRCSPNPCPHSLKFLLWPGSGGSHL